MKEQLQTIIKSYGDQIDGQTTSLMKKWTEQVAECLQSYESQVAVNFKAASTNSSASLASCVRSAHRLCFGDATQRRSSAKVKIRFC